MFNFHFFRRPLVKFTTSHTDGFNRGGWFLSSWDKTREPGSRALRRDVIYQTRYSKLIVFAINFLNKCALRIFLLTLFVGRIKGKNSSNFEHEDGGFQQRRNSPRSALCAMQGAIGERMEGRLHDRRAIFSVQSFSLAGRSLLIIHRRFCAVFLPVPSNNAANTARYYLLSNMRKRGRRW